MEPDKTETDKEHHRFGAMALGVAHWLASNRRLALFVEFVFLFLVFGEFDRVIQIGLSNRWGHPSTAEANFRSWTLIAISLLLLVTLAIIGFTIGVLDLFAASQDGVTIGSKRRRKGASLKKLIALDESDAKHDAEQPKGKRKS